MKSDTIEVLIPKTLIDSCISHDGYDEFVSVNVLREYGKMNEITNPKTAMEYSI